VDNLSSNFAAGYLYEDANGDGLIDSGDMIMVENNARTLSSICLRNLFYQFRKQMPASLRWKFSGLLATSESCCRALFN
jgi:hypothetical protein